MSIPNPWGQLEGHCAAVHDDTLYVLTPTFFQSLPLHKKAQWSKEPSGASVTDPACVQAGNGTDAALYVIGGRSNDRGYSGLQRFSFASKQWQNLTSASSDVISQRTSHSAAYLADSESILVYAGSQPNAPSQLSSQTFVISTHPPYNIESYTSRGAPPANLPILLSWTTSSAIMMGGASDNKEIYTFQTNGGWRPYGTNLSQAPPSTARGIIINTADDAKVLELYDFGVSPNTVSQIVLQDTDGRPAADGQTVGDRSSSRIRERRLSLTNWPRYNAKNAPTATRTDYSVSQGSHGLAVIAGGSAAAPLAMFNQDDNSWINAANFFDSKQIQHPLKPSTTPTPSHTSSTPSAAATTSSSSGSGASPNTLRLLGIVLGVLCGVAALFILTLLYFRYRRSQRRKMEGNEDEKTGRMSFQDRGASFMKEAGGPITALPPPNRAFDNSNGSHSSLAIIAGKIGSKRNTVNHVPQKSSFDSTANLVKKDTEMGEPMEMMEIGDQNRNGSMPAPANAPRYGATLTVDDRDGKARRKRSSGWSKYFATSGPTGPNGVSHIPDAYIKPHTLTPPLEESRTPSTNLLPPLDLGMETGLDGQRLSHVATGSPSLSDSREDFAKNGTASFPHEGQAGLIIDPNRTRSISESISSYAHSTISSNITGEFYNDTYHAPWTPTTGTFKDASNGRRTSSLYSASVYEPRAPSRGKSGSAGFFPGAGTSYRPPRKSKTAASEVSIDDWPAPPSRRSEFGNANPLVTVSDAHNDMPYYPPDSTPAAYSAPQAPGVARKKPMSTDLTWLDLGQQNRGPGRI